MSSNYPDVTNLTVDAVLDQSQPKRNPFALGPLLIAGIIVALLSLVFLCFIVPSAFRR